MHGRVELFRIAQLALSLTEVLWGDVVRLACIDQGHDTFHGLMLMLMMLMVMFA